MAHNLIVEKCPKCTQQLAIKIGPNGRFIACTNYPDCTYTRHLHSDNKTAKKWQVITDKACPQCKSDLVIKNGRYGEFIACSGYPQCKYIEPLKKPLDTGVECPQCQQHNKYDSGNLLQRKTSSGKTFYGCSKYPNCHYAVSDAPIADNCPACDWSVLILKATKRRGIEKCCPQPQCPYVTPYEGDPDDVHGPRIPPQLPV